MTTETVTLTIAELCQLYWSAYHGGHHDTVESRYTDVLPVDMSNYHEEAVREWLSERPHD